MSGKEKPRTIKLLCPSLRKIVELEVWDEQRLDLGFIAKVFGLVPSTLKLNGHFISRGVDLVSSSVTWSSLLSFFSAKGFSTGKDDKDALIVDGKLCKAGTKRAHDNRNVVNGIHCTTELKDLCINSSLQTDNGLHINKKLRESGSVCEEGHLASEYDGPGFKRKQLFEDASLLKKLKIHETNSDIQGIGNNQSDTIWSTCSTSSYVNGNLKRMREKDVIVAAPCKKIR
ncbi:hypothetical protein HS088_TW10G00272 [Tripterygium wilfordii]|uniref:Uncharacterized protein n=1 Tax=Tripterygium wilfordii TaxID=458696 RepID=A0A7J7D5D7_TRIWF|nr:uncharacterized protein LOC120007137 isoform X1 [Tripterygium wilfordii]KAF5741276.1 hypothetical protein HS088_TW10G00272 [Tripterygium wilfordii]